MLQEKLIDTDNKREHVVEKAKRGKRKKHTLAFPRFGRAESLEVEPLEARERVVLGAGEGLSGGAVITTEEVVDSVPASDDWFEAQGSLREAGANVPAESDCAKDKAVSVLPTSRSRKRVCGLPAGGLVGGATDTAPSASAPFSISSSNSLCNALRSLHLETELQG